MKTRKTYLQQALTTVLFLVALSAFGAPYHGEEFTYHQPDGSTFQIKLYGDEFYAVAETLEGRVVIRDPKTKFFCYATTNATKTEFLSTGVKVGQVAPLSTLKRQRLDRRAVAAKSRAERKKLGVDDRGLPLPELQQQLLPQGAAVLEVPQPFPPNTTTIGKRIGLVLLAQFPDRPGDVTITQGEVDAYCNDPDYTGFGNPTSVYGYFDIQSNGALQYNCVVTAYFTAANNRDYYTDPIISYGTRAKELIEEGLTILKAKDFDFTKCDANNNGVLDGVNCLYAGSRVNAWAEGLWPHKSDSAWSGLSGTGVDVNFPYQITDMKSSLTLRTFCHENGHMICGFPDLYSYDDNASNLAQFSLMAPGDNTHPSNIDAYLKIHAGWANVIDIDSSSHLRGAVQVDQNTFYRYRNPSENGEYFLISMRTNSGYEGDHAGTIHNANPTDGLVIYHAYERGSNTNSSIFTADSPSANYSRPYELMVVEANPYSSTTPWYDDPTPGYSSGYHAGDVSQASDNTLPALKFWNTSAGRTVPSGLYIHNVSAQGDQMTFTIGSGDITGIPVIAATRTALTPSCDYGTDAKAETFSVFNSGGGTLNYSISSNVSWMDVSPSSGAATTEADNVTVAYDTDGLPSGTYNGIITITGAETHTISISLTVAAQPTMQVDTDTITTTLSTGNFAVGSFTVSNTGGGTLRYTLSESADWLTLETYGGIVTAELDEIQLVTNVTEGTYNTTITVSSDNATNSTQTVTVNLTIGTNEPPVIESTAWAAPDVVIQPGTTTVSVVASDPNGDPLTYTWSTVSGPGIVAYSSPYAETSEVSFSIAGDYALEVLVSDGVYTVRSEVSMTVKNPVDPLVTITANGDEIPDNQDVIVTIGALDDSGINRVSLWSKEEEAAAFTWHGADTEAPYEWNLGPLPVGYYVLTGKVFANDGGTANTATIDIKVTSTAAEIAITSHSNGDQVTDNLDVIVTVETLESSGIQAVDLHCVEEPDWNNSWQVSDSEAPFLLNLGRLPVGTYTMFAMGFTDHYDLVTSANITIEVIQFNTEPEITITSHSNGEQVLNNQNMTITVDASDDSGIGRVSLWSKEEESAAYTWHGAVTTTPYQWDLGTLPVGTYVLIAKAFANDGATIEQNITIEVVQASTDPEIIITSHSDGDQVPDKQNVIIAVDALDDSGIGRVSLWSKEEQAVAYTWHGAVTTTPYQWDLGTLPIGTYTLIAKAFTNDGATVEQNITIEVLPEITITSHSNGDQVLDNQDVIITVETLESSGIRRVDLFGMEIPISDSAAPFQFNLGRLPVGTYTLSALGFTRDNRMVFSPDVTIEVIEVNTDPEVSITSPVNDAQLPGNQDVVVTANASDDSGIARVHLWSKEAQVTSWTYYGKITGSPYEWNLGVLPAGTYTLNMKADANDGASVTTSVIITVNP